MDNSFDSLVEQVASIHAVTGAAAKSAVNQMLTVRNWIIGYYIVEYEQRGEDRAAYGSNLLQMLSLTHIRKILAIDDPFERFFTNWSASNAGGASENLIDRLEVSFFPRRNQQKPEETVFADGV